MLAHDATLLSHSTHEKGAKRARPPKVLGPERRLGDSSLSRHPATSHTSSGGLGPGLAQASHVIRQSRPGSRPGSVRTSSACGGHASRSATGMLHAGWPMWLCTSGYTHAPRLHCRGKRLCCVLRRVRLCMRAPVRRWPSQYRARPRSWVGVAPQFSFSFSLAFRCLRCTRARCRLYSLGHHASGAGLSSSAFGVVVASCCSRRVVACLRRQWPHAVFR